MSVTKNTKRKETQKDNVGEKEIAPQLKETTVIQAIYRQKPNYTLPIAAPVRGSASRRVSERTNKTNKIFVLILISFIASTAIQYYVFNYSLEYIKAYVCNIVICILIYTVLAYIYIFFARIHKLLKRYKIKKKHITRVKERTRKNEANKKEKEEKCKVE